MKKRRVLLALGTADIGKLLVEYTIPAIIAMIAVSLYNITDSIFIGHGVGVMALSGLAVAFPIMNLAVAFGSLIGVGAATLMSIRLGQKDYIAANYILGNVCILNLITGILFSVTVLIFLNPILIFFGASSQMLPYTRDFMIIILAGNVVSHTYIGLNALLHSAGHPSKAMHVTIIAVFMNLILNPLFIFKFGWGIRGSAAATIISQSSVLAWQIWFFSNSKSSICFKKDFFRLKKEIVKGIFAIGIAPFLLNATACVIIVLINKNLSFYGGNLAVGAYGIINRMAYLFVMIVFGLNQGMQPIVGYNYGVALYGRVTEVLKKTIIIAVAIMTFGSVLVELFPHSLASIFTDEKNLIDITTTGLRYAFMFSPFIGFQMVVSTFFQSIGKAQKTIFLSLTRQVIFLIPLLIILPKYMNISGVWISIPISDLASSIIAVCLFTAQYRKLQNKKTG
ncbi:MATE family efflux transporter [Candidatus Endomicrobiellum trichonymphae]|uniref:Multidrug export protein MepA n=1 Tax=Endomicrobium trichonymphae TaxID=1408204 RepID=A0A1E5IK02_ENDTX|nr:MATE family efflux transporter [Candidatus Endomicrobium trichonymphae]